MYWLIAWQIDLQSLEASDSSHLQDHINPKVGKDYCKARLVRILGCLFTRLNANLKLFRIPYLAPTIEAARNISQLQCHTHRAQLDDTPTFVHHNPSDNVTRRTWLDFRANRHTV